MENAVAGVAWSIRATLLLVSTLTVMAGAIVAPSLPKIAEVFGESPDKPILAKLVLSLPALAIVLFAPLSGWITDRYGRRRLLLAGLLLYVLAGSSGLYLDDPTPVLVGRFLLGIATAMIMTTTTTMISDLFHGPNRGRFLGFQAAFMALGGVVFLPLGGVLAQWGGWHWPFGLYFLALPLAFAAWLFVPEPHRAHVTPQGLTPGAEHAIEHIRWRNLLAVYAIAFILMTAMYLMPTQLPFHLKQVFQAGPLVAGLAVATSSGASALVGLLFGRLSRWISTQGLLAVSFLLMGLGYAVLAEMTSLLLLWPLFVIAGLGGGLVVPTLSHWLLRIAPPAARGRLSGGLISCIFLGQFLSPILVKPLVDRGGIALTFQFIGSGLVVLGMLQVVRGLVARFANSQPPRTSSVMANSTA